MSFAEWKAAQKPIESESSGFEKWKAAQKNNTDEPHINPPHPEPVSSTSIKIENVYEPLSFKDTDRLNQEWRDNGGAVDRTRPFSNKEKLQGEIEAGKELTAPEKAVFDVVNFASPVFRKPLESVYRQATGREQNNEESGISNTDIVSNAISLFPFGKAAAKIPNPFVKKTAEQISGIAEKASSARISELTSKDIGKYLTGQLKKAAIGLKRIADPKNLTPAGAMGIKQSPIEYAADLGILTATGYEKGRKREGLGIKVPFTDKKLIFPIPNAPIQAAESLGLYLQDMQDYEDMKTSESVIKTENDIIKRNPLESPTVENERAQRQEIQEKALKQHGLDALISGAIGIAGNQTLARATLPILKQLKKLPTDDLVKAAAGLSIFAASNASNQFISNARGNETDYGKRLERHGNPVQALGETAFKAIVKLHDQEPAPYPADIAEGITKKGERGMGYPNKEATFEEDVSAIERAVKMNDLGKAHILYNNMIGRLKKEDEYTQDNLLKKIPVLEDIITKNEKRLKGIE
jgi:hypothetical protein